MGETFPGEILRACERVASHAHGTPEWHAARAQGLGGSDAGVLLGLSPYTTPRQLWRIKTGRAPADNGGNAYTRCGQLLERAVLARAYYGHAAPGDALGSLRSCAAPYLLANIDGLYAGRLIEIKTTGKAWAEVPPHYVAQVRHYLYVTGLQSADVVECHVRYNREALVAAMERAGLAADRVVEQLCTLRTWRVEQDDAWLERYLAAARDFWTAVETDTWSAEKSAKDVLGW